LRLYTQASGPPFGKVAQQAAMNDHVTAMTEVDLTNLVELLPDDEKISLVRSICQSIKRDGTINQIREIVNSPGFNDV
jgi:hypothetical protein